MSSYFRPDPFGAVLLRLVETDRDVRRPELFFPKNNPSISHYAPALRERRHSIKTRWLRHTSILFCQEICNFLRLKQDAFLIQGLEFTVLHQDSAINHHCINGCRFCRVRKE